MTLNQTQDLRPLHVQELDWHDVIGGVAVNRTVLPFGIDETGAVVAWGLRPAAPHGLVVGPAGAGKTIGPLKSLLKSALRAGMLVGVVGPVPASFAEFVGKPGVLFVATSVEERAAALVDMRAELVRREAAATQDQAPVLLVIDDVAAHTAELRRWWAALTPEERQEWGSTASEPPMVEYVQQLVQPHLTDIYVLLGAQRLDALSVGVDPAQLRGDLGLRVSMGQATPIGSTMVWGDAHTGSTGRSVGEGVTDGVSIDREGHTTGSAPRRFTSFSNRTVPASWWDAVAAVAPDPSQVPMPTWATVSQARP